MSKAGITGLMVLALQLASAQAPGQEGRTLYKWEDAQGQVHYSDQPPADPTSSVQTHALPPGSPGGSDGDPDEYSVERQARRMEEDRREREAARLEQERKRAQAQRDAAELEAARERESQAADAADDDGYPGYVMPWRPIRPPRPPLQRPPRPTPAPLPGGGLGTGRP